ncbi:MAG: hypothetical protein GF411_18580 [Candidatus Lokiarchaeota archaeon]|nr:hypothetical protein [Candidatus Lokiarchaeota archaeon]
MIKRMTSVLLLSILIAQPLLAVTSTFTTSNNRYERNSSISYSLAAGTRLGPDDMTDHVPILINGTQDFVDQGWPGAGTSGNPYLIAGLNISWGIGEIGIHILNTTAYFTIRDCLVVQDSSIQGIFLENTTHGIIEYTTVESSQKGVSCYFANNTEIVNCDISASSSIAIELVQCVDSIVGTSKIFSDDSVGILVNQCPNFQSTGNNVLVNQVGNYAVYINQSNNTIYTGGSITLGGYNMRIDQSHFIDITNVKFYDGDVFGLYCSLVDDINLNNLYFEGASFSLLMDSCNDVEITDVTLEDCTYGIYIATCNNLYISNYVANDIGIFGFYLEDIYEYNIENVDIDMVSSDMGIYGENIYNGTFSDILLNDIGNEGIYFSMGENLTITNAQITDIDSYGVYLVNFDDVTLQDIHIESTTDTALYIDATDNLEVNSGSIRYSESTALYVDSGVNVTISNYVFDRNYEGVYATDCTNIEITNNEISKTQYTAMSISSCTNAFVEGNTIDQAGQDGIAQNYGDDITIQDNVMTDAGFRFTMYTSISYYEITFTGNTVNGLPVYYGFNESSDTIDANNYGQIIMINCTDMLALDGSYDSISAPIQLFHCTDIHVYYTQITNAHYGIIGYQTDEFKLLDASISGGGIRGIYLRYCDNADILDTAVSGYKDTSNSYGIHLYYSDSAKIDDCELYHNYRAIYMQYSDNTIINNSKILDHQSYGIWGWYDSDYTIIENSVIMNASWGIYGDAVQNYTVRNNVVKYCSIGVRIGGTSAMYWLVENNTIESNSDGLYISFGDYHIVTDNIIRWNNDDGIYCAGSIGNSIHHNIFAFNDGDNAWDNGGLNSSLWDDNVSMGNWWSDYTAPGTYSITGGSQIDYYPMAYAPTTPIIEQLEEVYYAEGSDGHSLTWVPQDDNLRDWTVTIDGNAWDADAWNLVDITVDIDGLNYGTHTLVLTVWDVDLNSASSTVMIYVYDDTNPSISNEPDRLAFVDKTGQEITWDVSDLHPADYRVFVDDEIFDSGSWTTGTLSVNIDSIGLGYHDLLIYVYDIDGNRKGDHVQIRVIDDDTAPTIDDVSDISYTEGSTENVIVWSPEDQYPDSYRIEFNSSTIKSGSWGGSKIILNVDGLNPGTYEYKLTVWDGNGNSASDTVSVTVNAVEDTTPPLIMDLGLLLIVGGGIGAVVVIVIIAMQIKKRRAG